MTYRLLHILCFGLLFFTGCSRSFPDIGCLRYENSINDLEGLYQDQQDPPDYPLTLEDVLTITLTRNLDLLVQRYELAVQEETAKAEELKGLPPLTLDGIFSVRNKNTAAFTQILGGPSTGVIQPQISSIKETRQYDIVEKINFIDFGLAYFKSKQEKLRSLLLDQQHLRTRQKLVLDTTESYWKAVTAKKAMSEAKKMIALSQKMEAGILHQIALRTVSEIQGLVTISHLYDNQIPLYEVEYEYENAKADLAGFMGLLPGTDFELADIEFSDEEIPLWDIKALEEQALLSRPELAVKDLEERIAHESVRMAILQMFPNAAMFGELNNDANPFLIHHYWLTAGIQATWNLFNIPQQWHYKTAAEQQEAQAYRARLALSIAVMTQVRLAYLGYIDSLEYYRQAYHFYEIKQRLATAGEISKRRGDLNGADALIFASDALLAQLFALKAYGRLQLALEQLNYTIGIPLLFGRVDIDEYAEHIVRNQDPEGVNHLSQIEEEQE